MTKLDIDSPKLLPSVDLRPADQPNTSLSRPFLSKLDDLQDFIKCYNAESLETAREQFWGIEDELKG